MKNGVKALTPGSDSLLSNWAFGSRQVLIGRAFGLITTPGWQIPDLLTLGLTVVAAAVGQGRGGELRNFSVELLAQKIAGDIESVPRVEPSWQQSTRHPRSVNQPRHGRHA